MLFTAYAFWGFFALIFFVYWLCPARARWVCLLAADVWFYLAAGAGTLAFTLLIPAGLSYAAGRLLPRVSGGGRRWLLAGGLVGSLGFLFFYKYAGFFASLLGLPAAEGLLSLALPFGISYYTLQTVSYLVDIYRGKATAEKHFGYYLVSITFFPLMLTGPIERPTALLPQLRAPRTFSYENALRGTVLALWGLFEKLTVANILGSFVDAGFNSPSAVTGVSLLICVFLYSFQIYCDFAGYSNISRGLGLLLGLSVTQNFRQPYFAGSIREFWARWHISLSSWLRDYIYFPLGGSRKGLSRRLLNLLAVFLVSGLWHGANLCFLVWGALHGLYECCGVLTAGPRGALCARLHIRREKGVWRVLRTGFVFLLVSFAWLFFRVGSSTAAAAPAVPATAFAILAKIGADFTLNLQAVKNALVLLNFTPLYLIRTALLLSAVFAADWAARGGELEERVLRLRPGVRLALGWAVLVCILFFGVDTGAPIYFKF